MSTLRIVGDHRVFFTHFAAYGLAAILEAEIGATGSVHMDSLQSMVVTVDSEKTQEQLADVVRSHAARRLNSWVTRTHSHMDRESGTLSPRLTTPSERTDWEALQSARHAAIDSVALDASSGLDHLFIGALGEPAYWYVDNQGKPQPDRGASGWEMKTRNRGEEFVQNRLALLCRAVSERTAAQVLAGLTGARNMDEVGKNAVDSRTPTGLARPGATDNAVAWCALWGISLFPVVHDATRGPGTSKGSGRQSVTAGVFRGLPRMNDMARAVTYLPLFTAPLPLPRLRSVLVSASLARTAAYLALRETMPTWSARDSGHWSEMYRSLRRPADLDWLQRKGVQALLLSHIEATDNPNAPELHVANGRVFPLIEVVR